MAINRSMARQVNRSLHYIDVTATWEWEWEWYVRMFELNLSCTHYELLQYPRGSTNYPQHEPLAKLFQGTYPNLNAAVDVFFSIHVVLFVTSSPEDAKTLAQTP
jgi:hypothetical protein